MGVLESMGGRARPSIEVVPPGRGGDIDDILRAVELLMPHEPAFVSVTDHPGGRAWSGAGASPERVALRTKPGSLGTAVALREAFGVLVVPHIVASGADRLAVEDLLIDLHYAGFRDLFAIRGDTRFDAGAHALEAGRGEARVEGGEGYRHADELVAHVAALNRGEFAPPAGGKATSFTVGVAGYPEKHFEAPNPGADLERLVAKVRAGASYVITQMVFDAEHYRRFVAALRARGVDVPVIPGIKPLLRASNLSSIPRTFHVDIPQGLVEALEGARSPAEERAAGIEWAARLCGELLDAGAPLLHFFTMGSGGATRAVLDALYGMGV